MRSVSVTGGTAGISLATAEALLRRGHCVSVCGRDTERLASALFHLRSFDMERISAAVCDVRNLASVDTMVALAAEGMGKVDALINFTGVAFVTPFDEITPVPWRNIVDINLTGVFNCCHVVVPLLKKAGGGDLVNLGSRFGRYAFAGGTGYNTTKFGLQGFREALFLDLHSHGIRVSLVAPGTVATGLGGAIPEEWHLLPKDVADVVAHVLEADSRAAINWVELRPARPPMR